MDKKTELISRKTLHDKLIEPIKSYSGIYDADKEFIYQFSQEAPIKLIQKQLNDFDYNNSMNTAIKYIRNPQAEEFKDYK